MFLCVVQAVTPLYASDFQATQTRHDNGKIIRVERIGNFDKLSMQTCGEIIYKQSDIPTLKIYGPANLVNSVKVDNDNSNLIIYNEVNDEEIKELKNIKIIMTAPDLKSIEINGIARFRVYSKWESDSPVFNINGIGEIDIKNLECKKVEVAVTGIGEAEINVHCDSIKVTNNGIGKIKLAGSTRHLTNSKDGIGKVYMKKLRIAKDNKEPQDK